MVSILILIIVLVFTCIHFITSLRIIYYYYVHIEETEWSSSGRIMEMESLGLDEASSSDQDSADTSNLYDDLEFNPTSTTNTNTTTHNEHNDSITSDIDDAGIFLELGMSLDNNVALDATTTQQAATEKTEKRTCFPSDLNGDARSSSSTGSNDNTDNDVCATNDDNRNYDEEDNENKVKAKVGIQGVPCGRTIEVPSLHTEDREAKIATSIRSSKVSASQTRTALPPNPNTNTKIEAKSSKQISKDEEEVVIKSSNVDVNFILSYITKHHKTASGKKSLSVKESDVPEISSARIRKNRKSSHKSGNCKSGDEIDGKALLLTSTTNDEKSCDRNRSDTSDRDNCPKGTPNGIGRSEVSLASELGIIGMTSERGNSDVTYKPDIGVTCEPSSSGVTSKLSSDGICKSSITGLTVKAETSVEMCKQGMSNKVCQPSSSNDSMTNEPTRSSTVGMIMQMISAPGRSKASDFMNIPSHGDERETETTRDTRTATKKSKNSTRNVENQADQDMDLFEDILLGQDRDEV